MFRRRNQAAHAIERPRPPSDVSSLLAETATQLDLLIETAEQAAASVRSRAQESRPDAQETRRDILVHDLALELVGRVDALRDEAAELRRVLERSTRVFGQSDVAAPPNRAPSIDMAAPPMSAAPKRESAPRAAPTSGTLPSQGVILLATQMAVAGSGRAEIATRLREDFGVSDTEAVLSRALGAAR